MMRAGAVCGLREGHLGQHSSQEAVDRERRGALKHYYENRSEIRERARSRLQANREFVDKIKLDAGCADCGYALHPAALDFDHLPGTEKLGNITALVNCARDRLMDEMAKCEVVCANCHRIRSSDRLARGAMDNEYVPFEGLEVLSNAESLRGRIREALADDALSDREIARNLRCSRDIISEVRKESANGLLP